MKIWAHGELSHRLQIKALSSSTRLKKIHERGISTRFLKNHKKVNTYNNHKPKYVYDPERRCILEKMVWYQFSTALVLFRIGVGKIRAKKQTKKSELDVLHNLAKKQRYRENACPMFCETRSLERNAWSSNFLCYVMCAGLDGMAACLSTCSIRRLVTMRRIELLQHLHSPSW